MAGPSDRRLDRTSLVAGIATMLVGFVLLLDQTDALELPLGWLAPLLLAAIGVVLLAAGLEGPRRRR